MRYHLSLIQLTSKLLHRWANVLVPVSRSAIKPWSVSMRLQTNSTLEESPSVRLQRLPHPNTDVPFFKNLPISSDRAPNSTDRRPVSPPNPGPESPAIGCLHPWANWIQSTCRAQLGTIFPLTFLTKADLFFCESFGSVFHMQMLT
jgi:hypothetical protein